MNHPARISSILSFCVVLLSSATRSNVAQSSMAQSSSVVTSSSAEQAEPKAQKENKLTPDQQDAAHLLEQATELKKIADRTSKYELSLTFVRKADSIETQARRMRAQNPR